MAQEFTSENLLYEAIQETEKQLNINVVDYTATESMVLENLDCKQVHLLHTGPLFSREKRNVVCLSEFIIFAIFVWMKIEWRTVQNNLV